MKLQPLLLLVLALAVPVSALGVVWAEHQSRKLFVELEGLTQERDAMNVEWGQLLLEQNTLASHGRLEEIARSRLGMSIPNQDSIVVVKP